MKNTLTASPSVRDLGVIISDDLSWNDHIGKITQIAKQKAGWVLSIFKNRSRQVMIPLYNCTSHSYEVILITGTVAHCGLDYQYPTLK